MNTTKERAGIAGDASSELKAVQQAFFSWHEQQAPEFSTDVGTMAYNDRLANLSTAVFHTQYVRRVSAFPIDTGDLSRALKHDERTVLCASHAERAQNTHTHSLTHSLTPPPPPTQTHTHTLSLSLSHTHTHARTHARTHAPHHTHAYAHKHMHTRTHGHAHTDTY